MTVIGVLVCAVLVALLVARDALPDSRPRTRWDPLWTAQVALWLMFLLLVVPRAIALAT